MIEIQEYLIFLFNFQQKWHHSVSKLIDKRLEMYQKTLVVT